MLGHRRFGEGASRALVFNDWLSDTSSWDGALPLLEASSVSWCLTDLRGYGRSLDRSGTFTVEEAAADALALADSLGWDRFSVVGHSMSSLVAVHIAQTVPERVGRVVLLCPPPPRGFGYDASTLAAVEAVARGDDSQRERFVRFVLGDRLARGFAKLKAAQWRATAHPDAVAAYVKMFGVRGLPDATIEVRCPVLAVTGGRDAEAMRRDAVTRGFGALASKLEAVELAKCGHYPMQEAAPWLIGVIERFLTDAQSE